MTGPFCRGAKSKMLKNHRKCVSVGRSGYLSENTSKRLFKVNKSVSVHWSRQQHDIAFISFVIEVLTRSLPSRGVITMPSWNQNDVYTLPRLFYVVSFLLLTYSKLFFFCLTHFSYNRTIRRGLSKFNLRNTFHKSIVERE